MVIKVTALCYLMLFSDFVFAQVQSKKVIESYSVRRGWPSLSEYAISDNGRFLYYTINNSEKRNISKTIIQNINGGFEKSYEDVNGPVLFSKNSHFAIFNKKKDTLCIVKLADASETNIPKITTFKVSNSYVDQWIAYHNGTERTLVVRPLLSNKDFKLSGVDFYLFLKDELIFVQNEMGFITLNRLKLKDATKSEVWKGQRIKSIKFSLDEKRIVFIGEIAGNQRMYIYSSTSGKVDTVGSPFPFQDGQGWALLGIDGFSKDCNWVYFRGELLTGANKQSMSKPSFDVWSYQDKTLQSFQNARIQNNKKSVQNFVASTTTNVIKRLKPNVRSGNDVFVLNANMLRPDEVYWNRFAKWDYSIYSLLDTTKQINLPEDSVNPIISPSEKFAVYFDKSLKEYFSIDLITKKKYNITRAIQTVWTSYARADDDEGSNTPMGIAGWSKNDDVFIYDQNDVYLLDIFGKKKPINLTNGYGKKNNITFRFAMTSNGMKAIIPLNERILLSAFNRATKEEGFFWLKATHKQSDPQKLSMLPKVMMGTDEFSTGSLIYPIKAKDAQIYLLSIKSEKESSNLYWTSDFIKFNKISNIHPEKHYNWYTTELINWKTLNGVNSQGILYKPQNFDPTRKYPMIVLYYEKFSNGLHQFDLIPNSDGSEIRIPEYVSNGYLVFVPDIQYKMGNPGQSAYNSIIPAVELLSKNPWVDAKRIGLNGHSFGAYQTNYLITHSNLFAAACANSGWSNFTSASNRVRNTGVSAMYYYEKFRQRMDANMWERPDLYIEASPIFQAHKVTTPLLMMNNKGDSDVDFPEGVQFFLALRRLGKRAWMLQYDNGDHSLSRQEDQKDLSIRMRQFFDHYLKDAPAPKWMTRGIPASMKGIEDGLELDTEIKTPGEGILNEEAKRKADSLLLRKPITVEIK